MDNMVVDALSRRHNLFASLGAKFFGFEHIKELYRDDRNVGTIYAFCLAKRTVDDYYMFHEFLFKEK